MTLETNAFHTFGAIGNREDLSDQIYNVAPTKTPFLTAVGRAKATATVHEWQTDTIVAGADNKQLEGDGIATAASTATVRLTNVCQILRHTARVTGTQEAVSKAGRKKELAYQMANQMLRLKKDLEFACIGQNNTKVTGGATTAREMGSASAYIATSDVFEAGGASPAAAGTARTDGTTAVALTSARFKACLQAIWTAGGEPDTVIAGAYNRSVISTFTGIATLNVDANKETSHNSIQVYVSDWGSVNIVASHQCKASDVLILDTDMWKVAYLRPFQTKDLARTGDSTAQDVMVEATLQVSNEASSGAVFDNTTSA